MTQPTCIADLKPAPYNPRRIDPDALGGLQASLTEFGDVSGIVYNTRTGHLVCGHQRLDALKRSQKLTYNAKGHVIKGEQGDYPVRLVDWDEATEKAANVAANSPHIAGEWTAELAPLLAEIETELPELHEGLRLGELQADVPGDETTSGQGDDDSPNNECPECGHTW